eukprot:COSAG01_NODE_18548_length_1069_cov_0.894845_1_plen_187_part_10
MFADAGIVPSLAKKNPLRWHSGEAVDLAARLATLHADATKRILIRNIPPSFGVAEQTFDSADAAAQWLAKTFQTTDSSFSMEPEPECADDDLPEGTPPLKNAWLYSKAELDPLITTLKFVNGVSVPGTVAGPDGIRQVSAKTPPPSSKRCIQSAHVRRNTVASRADEEQAIYYLVDCTSRTGLSWSV